MTPAAARTDTRLCFFGDSFTNGTGDDDCLGWPGRLCAETRGRGHDVTLYNLGIRRDTSAEIAQRWASEAAARLPAGVDGRLVFSFGVNDCVEEAGQPRIAADASICNAQTILVAAREAWPTLMVGPPPACEPALDARVHSLSDALHRLCDRLDIPFLPLFPILHGNAVWYAEAAAGDGIHPNRGGYALIHEAVSRWPAWRAWWG